MLEITAAFVVVSVIQMVGALKLPGMMQSTGRIIGNMRQRTAFLLLFVPAVPALILAVSGLYTFGSEISPIFILVCTPLLFFDGFVQACCIVSIIDQYENSRQEKQGRIRSLNP